MNRKKTNFCFGKEKLFTCIFIIYTEIEGIYGVELSSVPKRWRIYLSLYMEKLCISKLMCSNIL